jgi:E3 ubiquitin-protein ligase UBR4
MEKNPYSSAEVGPLMRNVRERICKELDLSDPEIMELLVAEQIIAPELKITDVYEKVLWTWI